MSASAHSSSTGGGPARWQCRRATKGRGRGRRSGRGGIHRWHRLGRFLRPRCLGCASVGYRRSLVSLGRAAWFAPSRQDLGAGHVDLGVWYGLVRGCYRAVSGRSLNAALCGEPEVGILSIEGVDLSTNRSTNRPFFAVGTDAELTGAIGPRLEWVARGGVEFPCAGERWSSTRWEPCGNPA